MTLEGFGDATVVKNPTASAGDKRDVGLTPESRRSPRKKRQPAPVFLPRKFHEQRSLQATVHRVTKGETQLSD